MTEHSSPSFNEDPTVRINREVIDELDQEQPPLGPGEFRTLLPAEDGNAERTLFRVGEQPLEASKEADLFSLRINEEGRWVLESTGTEDAWVIPDDVEFSIGGGGVVKRLREEEPEKASAIGMGKLPMVVQRLVSSQLKSSGFSKIIIMAHPSPGEKPLLSIRNAGSDPLPMETHQDTPKEAPEPQKVEELEHEHDVPAAEKPTPELEEVVKVDLDEAPVAEPETTQAIDMTELLAEGREVAPEGEVTNDLPKTQPEEKEVEEAAPTRPPTSPKSSLSLAARLAGLDTEPEAPHEEEPAGGERLSIEGLDAAEALKAITNHFSSQLDEISKQGKLRGEEYLRTVPQALRNGHAVAESGVFTSLEELKKNFDEDVASFDDMSLLAGEYTEAEKGVFSNGESESEAFQAQQRLRKSAVEVMEKVQETLQKMEQTTVTALTFQSAIDNELRTVNGVYYQDVPQYETTWETVKEKTNKLVDTLNERTELGKEVRRRLEELEELQKNIQAE